MASYRKASPFSSVKDALSCRRLVLQDVQWLAGQVQDFLLAALRLLGIRVVVSPKQRLHQPGGQFRFHIDSGGRGFRGIAAREYPDSE